MTIKQYFYLAMVVIVAYVGYRIYDGYQELKNLRVQKQELAQNAQAWKDSADARFAREQTTAVFVRSLNDKLTKKDKIIVALQSQNSILVDSISVLLAKADTVTSTDSTFTVRFSGEKSIASYEGETEVNIHTRQGKYSVSIGFKPVKVGSRLIRNASGIWVIDNYSMTDGVQVEGTSTIDENVWREIQGSFTPPKSPDYFAIGGMVTQDANGVVRPMVGLAIKPNQYMILLQYNLSSYDQNISWQRRVSAGFYWFLF